MKSPAILGLTVAGAVPGLVAMAQPELAAPALAAHAVIAAGLAVGTGQALRAGRIGRDSAFLALAAAVLGPVGLAGGLLACGLARWLARTATPMDDWFASLFPSTEADPLQELLERLSAPGGDASVVPVPFVDLMTSGTPQHKQNALALIAGQFRPGFAPALHVALRDADASIRVQAATAAAQVEDRCLREAMRLGRALAERPDDAALAVALAGQHEAHAALGLVDADRARRMREAALSLCERAFAQQATPPTGAEALVARLLVALDRPAEALRRFGDRLADPGTDMALVEPLLEALYRERRFRALRTACRRLDAAGRVDPGSPLAGPVRLWSGIAGVTA